MSESVIIDAVRSPIGIKNGNLVGIRPDDLTAQVVKGLLARNENDIRNLANYKLLGTSFLIRMCQIAHIVYKYF